MSNHSRFCLAEEAGDLKAAEASAARLDSNEVGNPIHQYKIRSTLSQIWLRLSSLAMSLGDCVVAESAMMKVQRFLFEKF